MRFTAQSGSEIFEADFDIRRFQSFWKIFKFFTIYQIFGTSSSKNPLINLEYLIIRGHFIDLFIWFWQQKLLKLSQIVIQDFLR